MWQTSEIYFFGKSVENSCFNAVCSFAFLYVKCSLCVVSHYQLVSIKQLWRVTNRHCPDFEELKKEVLILELRA